MISIGISFGVFSYGFQPQFYNHNLRANTLDG